MKSIGERLKELRAGTDYTLEEVGKAINTTKQNLYKYENGIITNIPSDKIERLALIYNVSPAYIMGWTETEYILQNVKKSLDALSESVAESPSEYNITTIAAHAMEDLTEEEQQEVLEFIKFKKASRKE